MRFRIHRGATEIGGSCVELEAQGQNILLDLGLPLDAAGSSPDLLPLIPGLRDGASSAPLGIILSHSHGDHMGLLGEAHSRIPVYMGSRTRAIIAASAPFLKDLRLPSIIETFSGTALFRLGPFSITPYLTDHSAFDAYGFLIEANGRKLFYSGDFRGHGRKGSLVSKFLANPPQPIHTLLLEGTTLSRGAGERTPVTERELEDQILADMERAEGMVLACFSPQNIDRFVTIFRAAKRSNRRFIADAYLANILTSLNLPSLPQPNTSSLRVFLGARQKMQILRRQAFELLEPLRPARIYAEEICRSPGDWVMLFRESMTADINKMSLHHDTSLIYSMWPGYFVQQTSALPSWCQTHDIPLRIRHTSGHADPKFLQRFASALAPRQIVPIHTAVPHDYVQHFRNVKKCSNGEWYDV